MTDNSIKPYLIRAIYEWCEDKNFSAYIIVKVNSNTRVPKSYVNEGKIILNICRTATKNLKIGNDSIKFSAKFNGASQEISIPIDTIEGIYANENSKGMFFKVEEEEKPVANNPQPKVSRFTVIK